MPHLNKMNRLSKISIFLFIVTIYMLEAIVFANAIGVTPGRKTINFEPNLQSIVQFSIINNEKKDMKAVIYVEGELNSSITLQDYEIQLNSNEDSKSSSYKIQLPNKIKEPGIHEARIVVREIPVGKGATVGATAAVVSQLYVLVPYPGKFAKAKLVATDTQGDRPINFFIAIDNLGEQDIANAKATIDIFGYNNEKITTLATNSKTIKSKNKEDLFAAWNSKNINFGKYYAKATVT